MSERTRRERMKLDPVEMPERSADSRRTDFGEVNEGYTAELAMAEAERCLFCARPTCVEGCPVGVDIVNFVHRVEAGEFEEAAAVISADNSLPAVCGRVCPQETQCEGACGLAKKGKAIHIGHLERFVADYARDHDHAPAPVPSPTGKRVAIVGSGPSGIACASDLVGLGHEVTVFEALHEVGGVLAYGIPEFRLPKSIVAAEMDQLRARGVRFETNAVIGMVDTVDDLLSVEGYDAVFIGVGAGLPRFLNVPGENLIGVFSASEFLTRVNLMRAYVEDSDTALIEVEGKAVVVFGAGNTAMDAARTAVRLDAASVTIAYRRSREEMPARTEELDHAEAEGVRFETLVGPVELHGDDDGRLTGVMLQKMILGEPDADGRRSPVPVPEQIREIPVDVAIVAIGNTPNPLLLRATPDLEQSKWGTVVVDHDTGQTSKPGVFAGGDIVTGGATVILAMGAGRRAAAAIGEFLGSSAELEEELL
ncbi:MAG: NADPH-dependent glutamate synthase [Acidimicrobiales bacterium]|nr:MAG: NADPH-dependent glutamate synthase [Acidimicrobiales bacterium]